MFDEKILITWKYPRFYGIFADDFVTFWKHFLRDSYLDVPTLEAGRASHGWGRHAECQLYNWNVLIVLFQFLNSDWTSLTHLTLHKTLKEKSGLQDLDYGWTICYCWNEESGFPLILPKNCQWRLILIWCHQLKVWKCCKGGILAHCEGSIID